MGEYDLIFFPLTTSGGATATRQDALDPKRMPVADSEGRISYERSALTQSPLTQINRGMPLAELPS